MNASPNDEGKNDRIENLERDLYSRDAPPITEKKRPELSQHEKMQSYGWTDELKSVVEESPEQLEVKKHSLINNFFIAAIIFFLAATAVAAYIILGGFNVISTKNVDISVQGLVAVNAGEELSLDVIVKNNNNTNLENVTLYIEYPEGTRSVEDLTKDLTRQQIDLETVNSGSAKTQTIKAVFFGEKDSVKQIKTRVDYKSHGSNGFFTKEKVFDVTIKSAPIIMNVDLPQEVNSGQEITITIDVASNANTIIRGLAIQAEYPFGFSFMSSTPNSSSEKNMWNIGDLDSNEKRTIKIKGRMDGQNEEERTFRFIAGTTDSIDPKKIAIGYITSQKTLAIKKPFIGLSLDLNGRSGVPAIPAGGKVTGTLNWSNNLPIEINDATVEIKISGKSFDRNQVSVGNGGFYRSSDNTIIWDRNSLYTLNDLNPGDIGSVSFTVSAVPSTEQLLSQGRNMDIGFVATMKGTRVQGGVPQQISSSVTGQAKVETNIVPTARILYSSGPFTNRGPMPPQVDKETTYTVVWNLANAFNDVANTTMKAVLPPYVRWTGSYSPSSEQISFDSSSRTVTWTVPDLRAGVGYTAPSREVAFQIAFVPSINQANTSPDLVGNISVEGVDRFTSGTVEANANSLNTKLTNDPRYRTGDDRVRE